MKPLLAAVLFLAGLSFATTAIAMNLDQAVEQVRRDTGGRILSADTESDDGRGVHRIKVLTPDRRVRVIRIDNGDRGRDDARGRDRDFDRDAERGRDREKDRGKDRSKDRGRDRDR